MSNERMNRGLQFDHMSYSLRFEDDHVQLTQHDPEASTWSSASGSFRFTYEEWEHFKRFIVS